MTNYELITDIYGNEYILIDRGNGEFTSMTKAHYEELQAEQSIPLSLEPSDD